MKDLTELTKPLEKKDVELRIGSTKARGFSLLLYKTARTDVHRLNEVCGLNWKSKHFYDDKQLLCCEISIYNPDIKEWISRSDVGVESYTEKEKGSYSDSFKRAGFRFGIGLELYQSPFIWITWEMESKDKYKFKPKNFHSNNLNIAEYKVIDGKPKLRIQYNNKDIFDNMSAKKKQRIMTEDEFEKARLKPQKALDWAQEKNVKINSAWLTTLKNLIDTTKEK